MVKEKCMKIYVSIFKILWKLLEMAYQIGPNFHAGTKQKSDTNQTFFYWLKLKIKKIKT